MKNLRKTISFLAILIASICVFSSCAGEDSKRLLQNQLVSDYFYLWSSTQKGDTIIFDCPQSLKVSYGDDELTFNPSASVKLYVVKDTIYINSTMDIKPTLQQETNKNSSFGSSPITYKLTKNFNLNDGEVICAEATYEAYTYSKDGKEEKLPYMSISSIDFLSSKIEQFSNSTSLFKALLDFEITWKEENSTHTGELPCTLAYIKKLSTNTPKDEEQEKTDELLNTSYTQGINWKDNSSFTLFVEKKENWSISGQKITKYNSPTLQFYLNSKENKVKEVESFNFSHQEESSTTSNNLSQEGWQITKTEITKTFKYSNSKDSFEDTFVYPTYTTSLNLDGKNFPFELNFVFNATASQTSSISTSSTNITKGVLSFDGKTLEKEVITTLNLKTSTTPEDENIPTHGKILGHFISAVYDPSSNITKRCVVIRYEEGYHWGICPYEQYFPDEFTYTQSGFSGFNSVAFDKQSGKYRIARATENSSAIYWYREDNTLISGIDFVSCKVLGWKNIVAGKYSYKMNAYQEELSSNSYTLTITAPDGSKKTFKSQKRD
ncbi:MAG: hypothetical protein IKW58_00535 [Alphaproteobacteria bacterium]|nr:hypothetical protein [Alphaproteobacteria bacterium]